MSGPQDVICPRCRAGTGQTCRRGNSKWTSEHAARVALSRAHLPAKRKRASSKYSVALNNTTRSLADRYVASQRAALACGCGGATHPEHEVDDLVLDSISSGIGSEYFTGGGDE